MQIVKSEIYRAKPKTKGEIFLLIICNPDVLVMVSYFRIISFIS